jgi:protein-S-isoprenylcysteine O-methyltransferase Ste14
MMLKNRIIENIIGVFTIVLIAIFFTTSVPFKIIGLNVHQVMAQLYSMQMDIVLLPVVGILLILVGIIGYLVCIGSFVIYAQGTPLPGFAQDNLMVTGIFKYVIIPIYLSWYLILLGETIFFRSLDLLIYLLAWMVFFHLKVILLEEPWLRKKHGKLYNEYCNKVHRWIPRLKT